MEAELASLAAGYGGVFSSSQAATLGYGWHRLAPLVASGEITRLGRSSYVDTGVYRRASPEQRHALRTRADVAGFGGRVAASHYSALTLLGLPVHGADLHVVRVTRRQGTHARRRSGLVVHAGPSCGDIVHLAGETACVEPTLAVLGAAMVSGSETGLVAADAALSRGMLRGEQLVSRLAELGGQPYVTRAARAVALVDGGSESVAESRARWLLHVLGFQPRTQVEISDERGLVGRVDFLLGSRVVIEVDGKLKYAGPDGPARLFQEKQREDRLRELGYEVVRLTWADLDRPWLVETRIRRALWRSDHLRVAPDTSIAVLSDGKVS